MENKLPNVTLRANQRPPGIWVSLLIISVFLLFTGQSVFAQTPCATPIPFTVVGEDASSATANDAKIRVSGALTGTNKVGYSAGATYSGPAFAAAPLYSSLTGGYISQTLANPGPGGTVYTIRVFSEDGSCYTDQTFTLAYVNFNTAPINPDIEVTVASSPSGFVTLGSTVSVVITVQNKGTGPATGVEYTIGIPAGLTGVAAAGGSPTVGTYNGGTNKWAIGNLAVNQTVTLTLTGTVSTRGVKYLTAALSGENETDLDSSPTTNNAGEDDQGSVCISTPFDYCTNDEYTITLPSYTGIQWFKDGTQITAGNAAANGVKLNGDNSLTIFSAGEYSYNMTVGPNACPSGGCCPIKVEPGKPPVLVAPGPQTICFNAAFAAVTASNTQATPNGTFIYQWYNDNGAANPTTGAISGQTALAFTALPTAVGVYQYKLKAYEQGHPNCADSVTVTLTINALPTPTIASNSPVCEQQTITLTGGGAGTGGTYDWTGPSSFTATGATPTRPNAVEAFEGTYVLTVTNGLSCSATATVAVVVNPKPLAPVVADKTFCAEDPQAALVATALTGNTLLWYGNNSTGGVSSTTTPIHNPTTAGITLYYVSQIDDATACESDREDLVVTVNAKPTAPATTPVSACQNSTPVDLTASATAATGYTLLWYGMNSTGGTSSTTGDIAPTNTVGTTTYFVSRKDNTTTCESNRSSIAVEIRAIPVPTITSNSPVCEEATINLTADGAGSGGTYVWSGPSGFTANIAAPTRGNAVEAYEGTYIVTMTNGVNCSASTSVAVVVNPLPAIPATTPKVFCAEDASAGLVATALTGNHLLWYGNNSTGGVSSTTTPIHDPTTAGITQYYATQVDDVTGCESDRDDAIVTVNATPLAPGVAPVTYCQDATPTALAATGDSGNTILWYVGGSTTTTAPTPNTATAGLTYFYVSQTIPGTGCESGMAGLPVTVNPKPVATVIAVNSLCVGSVSQNNAKLILTRYRDSDEVSYNIGGTYVAPPTATNYATVPVGGVFASSLPNPTAATQDYTVRIKNSFGCTIDRLATLTKTDCGCPGGYCEPATVTKTK